MRLGLFRSATSVQLLEITVGAALMCVMAMILITSFIQQRIFPHIPVPTPISTNQWVEYTSPACSLFDEKVRSLSNFSKFNSFGNFPERPGVCECRLLVLRGVRRDARHPDPNVL